MADETRYFLEDIHFYGTPGPQGWNPVFAKILVGQKMRAVVTDYTNKVAATYAALQAAEGYNDPDRQFRKGGHPPGQSIRSMRINVDVGGFKNDRIVGEVSVNVPYAAATEWGRKAYHRYRGTHVLREALYSVLPQNISGYKG